MKQEQHAKKLCRPQLHEVRGWILSTNQKKRSPTLHLPQKNIMMILNMAATMELLCHIKNLMQQVIHRIMKPPF